MVILTQNDEPRVIEGRRAISPVSRAMRPYGALPLYVCCDSDTYEVSPPEGDTMLLEVRRTLPMGISWEYQTPFRFVLTALERLWTRTWSGMFPYQMLERGLDFLEWLYQVECDDNG